MRLKVLGLCLAILGFVGCKEVTIQDGHVPQEYLSQAKQLEGKYYGNFDGKKATIEIYFEGDRPFLIYQDAQGNDPLDINCNSKIDLLKKIILVKENGQYVLDQAFFGFHPGTCRMVRGREIDLEFNGTNKIIMSIYEDSDYVQNCSPGAPPPYGGGPNCRTDEIPHYILGKFTR